MAALVRPDFRLIIPALVVAEVAYFAGTRLGAQAEARFVRGLSAVEVYAPNAGDWERVAQLILKYADLGLGTTDASVVALAERLDAGVILTLDRRHFGVVQHRNQGFFTILPD